MTHNQLEQLIKKDIKSNYGARLQIMIYDKLVAEVIGTDAYCNMIWTRWCKSRYENNKPFGCSAIYRNDIKRIWNVKIGETL